MADYQTPYLTSLSDADLRAWFGVRIIEALADGHRATAVELVEAFGKAYAIRHPASLAADSFKVERGLAAYFSSLMRVALGGDYLTAVARNAGEFDSSICHTHDFLDANEIMMDAFAGVMGRPYLPADGEPAEADTDLVNRAWSLAKNSFFTLSA